MAQELNDDGKNGNKDDRQDDQEVVVSDKRNVPEVVTAQNEESDPGNASDDVEGYETPVGHPSDAGDKGRKGPDDGNESGKDDRFPAIFLVKTVSPFQMFLIEETGILLGKYLWTHFITDPVIEGISPNGRETE